MCGEQRKAVAFTSRFRATGVGETLTQSAQVHSQNSGPTSPAQPAFHVTCY